MDVLHAKIQGDVDYSYGAMLKDNPFAVGSPEHTAWVNGWEHACFAAHKRIFED